MKLYSILLLPILEIIENRTYLKILILIIT